MAEFEKGHKKLGGRAKGTSNKTTEEAKELFMEIMAGEVDNVKTSLESVRKDNEATYLNLLSKLLPYFIPKKIDIKSDNKSLAPPDYSDFTFEQLYELKHGKSKS